MRITLAAVEAPTSAPRWEERLGKGESRHPRREETLVGVRIPARVSSGGGDANHPYCGCPSHLGAEVGGAPSAGVTRGTPTARKPSRESESLRGFPRAGVTQITPAAAAPINSAPRWVVLPRRG
jgi:hypothetical protein